MKQPDLCDDSTIWERLIQCKTGEHTLLYFSPADLMLHMIFHAVYEHRFDNGPVTLTDLAYLMSSHTIDWHHFWSLAEQLNGLNGCILTLKMVEEYFGPQPIIWPEHHVSTIPEEVIQAAALLTLRNYTATSGIKFETFMKPRPKLDTSRLLLKKIFPTRDRITQFYKIPDSSPLLYYWYVHRIIQRLFRIARSPFKRKLISELDQLNQVKRWLQKG